MPIYNCSKNECVRERCPSSSPYVCTDTSSGAPYGGCFTLEQANSLPNLNFCNSVVCDQHYYDIPACNREVCDYLDRCNNRGRFIPGASGSCMGCSENTT